MNIQSIREYCFRKSGITEDFPFGESTLVFRVKNKIFLLASLDAIPLQFNIKCDPATAIDLREQYDAVTPGYHMDKRHWITVKIDGSLPTKEVLSWIDASYELVVQSLPKKLQQELAGFVIAPADGTNAPATPSRSATSPLKRKAPAEKKPKKA